MKFSEKTVSIFKNFQGISPSLAVRKGNQLSTVNKSKNLIAFADIEDQMPQDFAIADLSGFVGCLSLFNEPELTFHGEYVTISQGQQTIRYTFCSPRLIPDAPERQINIGEPVATFELKADEIKALTKSIGFLKLPEYSMSSQNGKLVIKSMDRKNLSGNEFSVTVVDTFEYPIDLVFSKDTILSTMGGWDYKVEVSSKGVLRLTHPEVTYIFAPES